MVSESDAKALRTWVMASIRVLVHGQCSVDSTWNPSLVTESIPDGVTAALVIGDNN